MLRIFTFALALLPATSTVTITHHKVGVYTVFPFHGLASRFMSLASFPHGPQDSTNTHSSIINPLHKANTKVKEKSRIFLRAIVSCPFTLLS